MNFVDKYSLCIRRGNNNYLPIDWVGLNDTSNQDDIYNLEKIDRFTVNTSEEELKIQLLENNYINGMEYECPIIIVYMEKGSIRILNEGPIFVDLKDALDNELVIDYLINNINNRQDINKIYNYLAKYKEDQSLADFLYAINKTKDINPNMINNMIVERYNKLSYINKRRIGFYIVKNLIKVEDKMI